MKKKGVLLINLGSPESPTVNSVRKFHRAFFSDPFVFDMNPIARWMLRNLIILPFRSPEITKQYKKIWMEEGSPLNVYGKRVRNGVAKLLGEDYAVELGMGYGKPSIDSAITSLKKHNVQEILVLPLFPQNATSTIGSVTFGFKKLWKQISPSIPYRILPPFFDHPQFINSWATVAENHINKEYDHIVFSYHGLPERHILKDDPTNGGCLKENCCSLKSNSTVDCYRSHCYATTRALIEKLDLETNNCTLAFQSRFGKDPWIKPYLDDKLIELANAGKQNILVFSPSFVTDCLETTHEIGVEYNELFIENGGTHLDLVPSLNDHPKWIETIASMITAYSFEKKEQTQLVN